MDIDTILEHFSLVDPVMAAAGHTVKESLVPIEKATQDSYLSNLCESIVSQQLSTKAASTIWARTFEVINDWSDADAILGADANDLRRCGLSFQKINYVKNIAMAIRDNALHIHRFDSMTNDDICRELMAIKGIGQWTAEMFLMFTLAREDIFSAGDLGLRNSMKKLYDLEVLTPAEANTIALRWSPYRTTASRILWNALDNKPY